MSSFSDAASYSGTKEASCHLCRRRVLWSPLPAPPASTMHRLALLGALGTFAAAQQPGPAALEPNGDSGSPSVSDDGKFVVFESCASNFVDGDQRDTWDVFLLERATGKVSRVSDDAPLPARSPMISGDGRWIIYFQADPARATVPGTYRATEHPWRVALFDRQEGAVRWLGEAEPTYEDRAPSQATISRDGRHVVFPVRVADGPAIRHIDTRNSTPELITAPKENGRWHTGLGTPFLSASGRFLVFSASAEDMTLPLPTEGCGLDYDDEPHIFRRELETGRTEFVSNLAIASIGYGDFYRPRVSDDGRYVAYDHCDQRWFSRTHVGFVSDLERRAPGRLLPVDPQDELQGSMAITWMSSDGRCVLVRTHGEDLPILAPGSDVPQVVMHNLEAQSWTLVSRSPDGHPADQKSDRAVAANDRSVVAFTSLATNLVANDTNHCTDVFLFEPATSRTNRIVPHAAVAARKHEADPEAPNADSRGASISDDGAFVAFASLASNFDERDRNGSWDVFLLDCATGRIERLSVEPHDMVSRPAFSGDGRWIAWWSRSESRPRGRGGWSLCIRERATGKTAVVQGLAPELSGFIDDPVPSISRDGSSVVFLGTMSIEDHNCAVAKLYERKTGAVSVVSVGDRGEAGFPAWGATISGDGGSVAFGSQAGSLAHWPSVAGTPVVPLRRGYNIYVRDLASRRTHVANGMLSAIGWLDASGSCRTPLLSGDGRTAAFNYQCDLDAAPQSELGLIAEMTTDAYGRLTSLASDAAAFRGFASITWLSADGRTVLASTNGEGVLGRPVARFSQIFVQPLHSGEWTPISRSATGEFANRPCEAACASRDLSRIVFESEADNLVAGDTNNARDIFIVDRKTGKTTRVEARH